MSIFRSCTVYNLTNGYVKDIIHTASKDEFQNGDYLNREFH